MSGTATGTKQIENDRVIVTLWSFGPGDNTGWHKHAHDYVVVPLMDGVLKLETPNGPQTAELKQGVSYAREAGVEHDVINAGEGAFAFIEIELK
jgi:quercetin dioxygenase-like cupin family protein